jgi:trk system potassium uptake protein
MFVIIAGGGRTGAHLAGALLAAGHTVRVIENRPAILELLAAELPAEVIVNGDASSPDDLEAAGISSANVLAAVTGEDDVNLVITTLGRFEFGVPRTIGRVNEPKNAWLFTPEMGVDVAVNQADIMANLIAEEMSMGDMMTLLKLRKGAYAVVEEKIPAGAKAAGVAIKDLALPETCVIAAIIRRGKVMVPRGVTAFEVGDEVLAVADQEGAKCLAGLFARPGNPES